MSRLIHHLLLFVLALAVGAAGLAWGGRLAPLAQLEAGFSKLIVAAALGAPYVIEQGTAPGQTWIARRLTGDRSTRPLQFLGLGDDPQQVFERNPPSAGDFAVILSQLKRQQHNRVAISLPMVWDEVDPIAQAALEDELASFTLAVCASPLARGISPQPMPPAFTRASVPRTRITGNTRLLPLVNRTANSPIILGNQATLAGFTLLESEDPPESTRRSAGKAMSVALLACWDDRVVLAFPLLVAMAHEEVRPDELEIRLGEFIRLGQHGRLIPIDAFGRFELPPALPGAPRMVGVPAEALIEALAEGSPSAEIAPLNPPIILRDERTHGSNPEVEFAAVLGDLVAALESSPRPGPAVSFRRPPLWAEALLLVPLAALSSLFLHLDRLRRMIASLVTAALTVILLLALGQHLNLTPAGVPALGVLATGLLARGRRCTTRPKSASFSPTTHFQ